MRSDVDRPAGHAVQSPEPSADTVPASHARQTVPSALLYSPARQRVGHSVVPWVLLTVPAAQLVHIVAEFAPSAWLNFPTPHLTQ